MEEIQTIPVVRENNIPIKQRQGERFLIKQEPDTYSQTTLSGLAIAGGTAIAGGAAAYKTSKGVINKFITSIENELVQFMKEKNKLFKGFPNALKVNMKYIGALLTGVAAAALVFKDSDKDGKLDLLEGVQKLIKPGE